MTTADLIEEIQYRITRDRTSQANCLRFLNKTTLIPRSLKIPWQDTEQSSVLQVAIRLPLKTCISGKCWGDISLQLRHQN